MRYRVVRNHFPSQFSRNINRQLYNMPGSSWMETYFTRSDSSRFHSFAPLSIIWWVFIEFSRFVTYKTRILPTLRTLVTLKTTTERVFTTYRRALRHSFRWKEARTTGLLRGVSIPRAESVGNIRFAIVYEPSQLADPRSTLGGDSLQPHTTHTLDLSNDPWSAWMHRRVGFVVSAYSIEGILLFMHHSFNSSFVFGIDCSLGRMLRHQLLWRSSRKFNFR